MSYAGDVEPSEAYAALERDPRAVLVDVRTRPELVYVGHPDLGRIGKQIIAVEWQQFPSGQVNSGFVEQLAANGVPPDAPVFFICRSGGRSRFAAMAATAGGYTEAYNVAHGFEGPTDPSGRRGTVAGWKVAGLPWRQS